MKRHSLKLIFIFVAGVVLARPTLIAAQTPQQDREAHALWLDGRNLYDDFKFAEAEKKFREALSKYPKADQIDRQAYYLILTLEKLNRITEARAEIQTFLRNYPSSKWSDYVNERRLDLGGKNVLAEQEQKIQKQRAAAQQSGTTELPMDASYQAQVLQKVFQNYPDRGFENARELLKKDPSDPAVLANLGTIYLSRSPQALPFLMDLMTNPTASPKTREVAFYWFSRKNPNKAEVAEELMAKLKNRENEPMVSEALFQMRYEEHREVLAKIAESSNPDKFSAMEKIFRRGSITLKSDLLTILAKVPDRRALDLIVNAAENDPDLAVRTAAVDALLSRSDVGEVKTLEQILKGVPPRPTPTPGRGVRGAAILVPVPGRQGVVIAPIRVVPPTPGAQRSKLSSEQVPVITSPPR
jgi:tetratricopeptide (TPR) repeat protein